MKTFWGWHEKQLPDGTLILTSPTGQTQVTIPGSALLFPSLCYATGGLPAPETDLPPDYSGDRSVRMPKRRRTRAKERAYRCVVLEPPNATTTATLAPPDAPKPPATPDPPHRPMTTRRRSDKTKQSCSG